MHSIDGLREGMVLPGIVTNVAAFGAFVDIGVKQDGWCTFPSCRTATSRRLPTR